MAKRGGSLKAGVEIPPFNTSCIDGTFKVSISRAKGIRKGKNLSISDVYKLSLQYILPTVLFFSFRGPHLEVFPQLLDVLLPLGMSGTMRHHLVHQIRLSRRLLELLGKSGWKSRESANYCG